MKKNNAIIPPICVSTIFAMEAPFTDKEFQYSRIGNPTRKTLETTLAHLEDAKFCSVFSSGSSAIATFLLSLHQGDTVLCHTVMYEGTQRLFQKLFNQFGIHVQTVDMKNMPLVKTMMKSNVQWIFFESPTNPLLEVLDIQSICRLAHQQHIQVAVDNTLASPVVQKPLALGADVVIESLSKAINGHSDVIGGLIATNDKTLHKKLQFLQQTMGAILSPIDCFLILRGLKTIHIRVAAQQKTAREIFTFLSKHANVRDLHFPNSGSVLSFRLKQSMNPNSFLKRLQTITIAQSFGGIETVIQQPTRMMHLSLTKEEQKKVSIDDRFFRLSIGLENAQDIIHDLTQALV